MSCCGGTQECETIHENPKTQTTLQEDKEINTQERPSKPRRRIVVRGSKGRNAIPDALLNDSALQEAISTSLPKEYEFEIPKTIWKIQQHKAKQVALQMPEGLLMYACILSDIFIRFARVGQAASEKESFTLKVIILGDVTYGACCVDDLGAKQLDCDLLVHYGHSCLVPISHTVIPCLYVFVEIHIDVLHLVDCVCATFPSEKLQLELMGVVQFRAALTDAATRFKELHSDQFLVELPQAKPLSPGEVLGCTAPVIAKSDHDSMERVMIFVADGRFHLEAAMIANPTLRAYRYDPYSKTLTQEWYDTPKMKHLRTHAIRSAQAPHVKTFGIILGTLGRQGNPAIVKRIMTLLRKNQKRFVLVLLSEVFPSKLDLFKHVDAWVQVACPRLSVDWGHHFAKPLLNTYELEQCFVPISDDHSHDNYYPMDYYMFESGPWTNYHSDNKDRALTTNT